MSQNPQIQTGQVLVIQKPLYRHTKLFTYPFAVGPNGERFLENTPSRGVNWTDFSESDFQNWVETQSSAKGVDDAWEVVTRAVSKIGKPYNLLNWNCEHFTNFALTGEAQSPQVETGFKFGALITFVVVAFAATRTNARRRRRS